MRATIYRRGVPQSNKDVKSELAAKQFAGYWNCDGIKIEEDGTPTRFYILYQGDGRLWHGPNNEEHWEEMYLNRRSGSKNERREK